MWLIWFLDEPSHDKTNVMISAPSKDSDQPGHLTLIRLGRCSGWSESSLGAQVILLVCHAQAQILNLGLCWLFFYWAFAILFFFFLLWKHLCTDFHQTISDTYIIRNSLCGFQFLRHTVVFRRHDDSVENNTERDGQVKERLWRYQVEHILNFQPWNKETSFTAVVTTHTVPVDQFLVAFRSQIPIFFHCENTQIQM